ncbi:hypothetical protein MKW98_006194, partial [Papaver atlanticum]
GSFLPNKKKFHLPQHANFDGILAVTHNGTLIVSLNKVINAPSTPSISVKVINT